MLQCEELRNDRTIVRKNDRTMERGNEGTKERLNEGVDVGVGVSGYYSSGNACLILSLSVTKASL